MKTLTFSDQLTDTLSKKILQSTYVFQDNLVDSLLETINNLDKKLNDQLNQIIHDQNFLNLEGSWRGLLLMLTKNPKHPSLFYKLLNIKKTEFKSSLLEAKNVEKTFLYQAIYEHEYNTPGGQPYSVLIGDYQFSHQHDDVACLKQMGKIAGKSFTPFICSPSIELFGIQSWNELHQLHYLEQHFETAEYAQWRGLRQSEEAKFIVMAFPAILARNKYQSPQASTLQFTFHEENEKSAWTSAAYTLGHCIAKAYAAHGWTTAIRGSEGGGKVNELYCMVKNKQTIATQLEIPDRLESELSHLGFLPLCHYRNTDYAVFFGGQTLHKPEKFEEPAANKNSRIATCLPYLFAVSRFAHYLKIIARDKIGSFMEPTDCENWLNNWILNYVNSNPKSKQALKAKYPLAEARVEITSKPDEPGHYQAIAWLRPWLQFESLSTSLRLVADIPKKRGQ